VEPTRALLAELGIVPTIVNMPGVNVLAANVTDAQFREGLKQLDEDAAFAAAIGCRRFQRTLGATTSGGRTRDDHWKWTTDRLAASSEIVAKHDVRISLEFLGPLQFRTGGGGGGRRGGTPPDPNAPPPPPPTPFVWSLAETRRLCEASGSHIGITLDAWHWYHSDGTVADILATDRSRIVHVHVSDARVMPPADVRDNMRWLPGEGVIDLVGFFQALKKIGWAGGVACETIGARLDNVAPEEQARLGLEYTTAVMKKAGVI
jgi:sugar phosphate isomerase/epimerase